MWASDDNDDWLGWRTDRRIRDTYWDGTEKIGVFDFKRH